MAKLAKLDEYFGLMFRAVRADTNVKRVAAFFKRMLQMCFVNESNFAAATLLVISELSVQADASSSGVDEAAEATLSTMRFTLTAYSKPPQLQQKPDAKP